MAASFPSLGSYLSRHLLRKALPDPLTSGALEFVYTGSGAAIV